MSRCGKEKAAEIRIAMATKTAIYEASPRQNARMEEAIDRYIEKIEDLLHEGRETQTRIDKIRDEAQVIKDRVRARVKSLCGKSF